MSLGTNYCPAGPCSWMEGHCCTRAVGVIRCITRTLSVLPACGYREGLSTARSLILGPHEYFCETPRALHRLTLHTVSHTHGVVLLQSTPLQLSQGLAWGLSRSRKEPCTMDIAKWSAFQTVLIFMLRVLLLIIPKPFILWWGATLSST